MKTNRTKPTNCKIDPILYNFYLRLRDKMGAEIVHRRRRKSTTCIEIVFDSKFESLQGRQNSLKEAEQCGFWVVCRAQTKRNHGSWHGRAVFQLFLTPVHPKKRNEARYQAAQQQAAEVSFEPILFVRHHASRSLIVLMPMSYIDRHEPRSDSAPPRRGRGAGRGRIGASVAEGLHALSE